MRGICPRFFGVFFSLPICAFKSPSKIVMSSFGTLAITFSSVAQNLSVDLGSFLLSPFGGAYTFSMVYFW